MADVSQLEHDISNFLASGDTSSVDSTLQVCSIACPRGRLPRFAWLASRQGQEGTPLLAERWNTAATRLSANAEFCTDSLATIPEGPNGAAS
jgi:hypothetical protein